MAAGTRGLRSRCSIAFAWAWVSFPAFTAAFNWSVTAPFERIGQLLRE